MRVYHYGRSIGSSAKQSLLGSGHFPLIVINMISLFFIFQRVPSVKKQLNVNPYYIVIIGGEELRVSDARLIQALH